MNIFLRSRFYLFNNFLQKNISRLGLSYVCKTRPKRFLKCS